MRSLRSPDKARPQDSKTRLAGALERTGKVLQWAVLLAVLLAVASPPRQDVPSIPFKGTTDERAPVEFLPLGEDGKTIIGTVVVDEVAAYEEPTTTAPVIETFGRVNPQGAPQVFLLEREVDGKAGEGPWFEALLPVRPNGTTGFIRAAELRITYTDYRIAVDTTTFELELWKGEELVEEFPVGIGTGETPTPLGRFYLISLLRPPEERSVYGKYAYGLSAYSEVITDWEGGGVVGLHGTNDPATVGQAVSHGCIRMRNRDISKLVPILPLGTPVEIT